MRIIYEFFGFFLLFSNSRDPDEVLNNEKRPNIVFVLTDDQDVELGSMHYMRRTLLLIRNEGAEMKRAYSTTPICCPSRSSLLTGRYVHNHNVYTNDVNCTGPQWRRDEEPQSFGVHLQNSGYRTGYFGKYLNQYDGSYVPPGWHEWAGQVHQSRYYNYTVNENGKLFEHGDNYATDYFPDLVANRSVDFVTNSAEDREKKPFFLFVSFNAPHSPGDSAPKYSHLFFDAERHHNPAYNYAPNPDKQPILQIVPKMNDLQKKYTDQLMTKRLQTLQSVDEAIGRIYYALKRTRQLENTYFIYTSDHGFHLGQYGLVEGKGFHFESDIRVPFFIRGPGITPRSLVDEIILNIDFAPTFLDIAGVEIPERMDGRSFKKLFLSEERERERDFSWPDTFLIEAPKPMNSRMRNDGCEPQFTCLSVDKNKWKVPPVWKHQPFVSIVNDDKNDYTCIRTINATHDLKFCDFTTGEIIFHDLKKDPYELVNIADLLIPEEKLYYMDVMKNLKKCKGTESCSAKF